MKYPTLAMLALSATALAHDDGKYIPSSCLTTSILPVMTIYTYQQTKPTKLPSPPHLDISGIDATQESGDFKIDPYKAKDYNVDAENAFSHKAPDGNGDMHLAFAPSTDGSNIAVPQPGSSQDYFPKASAPQAGIPGLDTPEVAIPGAEKKPATVNTPAAPSQLTTSSGANIVVDTWVIGFMGLFAYNMLIHT
jgi:hypothetical protein